MSATSLRDPGSYPQVSATFRLPSAYLPRKVAPARSELRARSAGVAGDCRETSDLHEGDGPLGRASDTDRESGGRSQLRRRLAYSLLVKVFLSSVVVGFEEFRDAAAAAARVLGHEVKRSEDFAASSDTPQAACLAGIRWADAVVVLLGPRYGHKQPSGLSATHEEYREAKERCAVLGFAQENVEVEPDQERFIREVKNWSGGVLTGSFTSPDDLR